MGDSVFTVDLHHGGQMVSRKGGKEYLGGMVVEGLQFELDEWSLQEIVAALKEIGYTSNAKIWLNEPGVALKDGLRELKSDGDAMRMGMFVVEQETKHYHVYAVNECRQGNGVEITSNDEDYIPSDGEYSGNDLVEVEVVSQSESSSEDNRFDDSADDGGVTEDGAEIDVGNISSGYDTESLDSYDGDSDEPVRKKRYPRYNEADMSVDYEFRMGTEFNSIAEFKEAIKEHALLNGRDIRYVKNDKVRCRVKCKGLGGECPWMAFATCVLLFSRNNPGSKNVAPQGSAPAPAPHGSAPAPTPAETSTTPSATVSQRGSGRGRGRGRGGSRSGKARSATPAAAVSQPAPAPPASATTSSTIPPLPPPASLLPAPAPPVIALAPPLSAPDPRSSTTPPLPLPADPPQPAPAPTRSTAPPLPKTKIFGVRHSGRLKIGVRKAKARPSETVHLTTY
ncbi:hypothetical protein Ahy_B08g092561 [Arachis hypogaea]|uniref:Uncharacterized protein n=1 Tax=Arachis hypogaea TaxID=3818 RepID=A0A444Y469_ARAHY|nr:hypothetical protein Ahy_B08g092561 [Arachis hypogaea]